MTVFCSHQTTVISVYLLREKLFFPRQLLFLFFSPDNDCLVFIPDNSSSLFRTDDSFNFSLDNTCFLFFLVKRLSRQQLYNGISPKNCVLFCHKQALVFIFLPRRLFFISSYKMNVFYSSSDKSYIPENFSYFTPFRQSHLPSSSD